MKRLITSVFFFFSLYLLVSAQKREFYSSTNPFLPNTSATEVVGCNGDTYWQITPHDGFKFAIQSVDDITAKKTLRDGQTTQKKGQANDVMPMTGTKHSGQDNLSDTVTYTAPYVILDKNTVVTLPITPGHYCLDQELLFPSAQYLSMGKSAREVGKLITYAVDEPVIWLQSTPTMWHQFKVHVGQGSHVLGQGVILEQLISGYSPSPNLTFVAVGEGQLSPLQVAVDEDEYNYSNQSPSNTSARPPQTPLDHLKQELRLEEYKDSVTIQKLLAQYPGRTSIIVSFGLFGHDGRIRLNGTGGTIGLLYQVPGKPLALRGQFSFYSMEGKDRWAEITNNNLLITVGAGSFHQWENFIVGGFIDVGVQRVINEQVVLTGATHRNSGQSLSVGIGGSIGWMPKKLPAYITLDVSASALVGGFAGDNLESGTQSKTDFLRDYISEQSNIRIGVVAPFGDIVT